MHSTVMRLSLLLPDNLLSWRQAGSCRRRCRGTRPTSSRASTPTSHASCSPSAGVDDTDPAGGTGGLGGTIIEAIATLAGGARADGRDAEVDAGPRLGRYRRPWEEFIAPIVVTGWLPGYSDPEYYLRLLLHSESKTNEGGYAYTGLDEPIERARQGAQRPVAARTYPRRRPDGRRRTAGSDPIAWAAAPLSSSQTCTAGGSSGSRRRRSPTSSLAE